jgi:hypothetical protein
VSDGTFGVQWLVVRYQGRSNLAGCGRMSDAMRCDVCDEIDEARAFGSTGELVGEAGRVGWTAL